MSEVKYEWRKREKAYKAGKIPERIILPKTSYVEISGMGNPNLPDFSERVGVLFSISYAIKMMPKSGVIPKGYVDYTVYPLQGIWSQMRSGATLDDSLLVKEQLSYIVSVQQPSFVTEEVFDMALAIVHKKKPHPYLDAVRFVTREKAGFVQILHEGSYDSEPESFNKMKSFISENGLQRKEQTVHHEVYIKPQKPGMTEEEMKGMRTILRYEV